MSTIKFLKYDSDWMQEVVVTPSVKALPDWYKNQTKYEKYNDEVIPYLKACQPVFDAMTAGYVMLTPCDIEFYKNGNRSSVRVLNPVYESFVGERQPEHIRRTPDSFPEVHGHSLHHFHWWPQWAADLEEGYSALYVHPLNRYDLPFMTTNGIIDNDTFKLPGRYPFFLRDGFEGIIPAGTPWVQIIPFKREDWSMEIVQIDYDENVSVQNQAYQELRANGGHSVYRKNKWSPKHFN